MNNQELNELLQNNPVTSRYFCGVYSADEMPPKPCLCWPDDMATYIFNTDPAHMEGSHWVVICLRNPEKDKNVYFDSYGLPPANKNFKEFMENHYVWNKVQLQEWLSSACGQWCAFFIWHISLGIDLEQMVTAFQGLDTLTKDHKMNFWFNQIFGANEKVLDRDYIKLKLQEGLQAE